MKRSLSIASTSLSPWEQGESAAGRRGSRRRAAPAPYRPPRRLRRHPPHSPEGSLVLPFCVLLLLPLAGCAAFADGAAEGRRGNALMAEGDAEGAAAAFRRGIEATEEGGADPALRAALWNNLGLALYEQGENAEAAAAFDEATALAAEPGTRARYAYNAGTALARVNALEDAAARLRRALVARPDFPEARHNYEWVKRRLDGAPPEGNTPPEPSDFARRLKAQADALVAQRQYRDAYDLMTDGLRRDSTVAAYADYLQRLGDVVRIEEAAPVDSLR